MRCSGAPSAAPSGRRPRRYHRRPYLRGHKQHGAWHWLISTMREQDPEGFYKFFRMTVECFDWLEELVRVPLTKTCITEAIPTGERLAVTLRYLAFGCSQDALSYLFLISNQVISNIVIETTAVLWSVLKDRVFDAVSPDFWRQKATEFESMWQFPMCLGAMDGKHVFVQKFPMRGSELYNYKFSNSLILFAVCDAKYRFIMIDDGARGRESDGGVFDRSSFGQLFNNHELELPPAVYNEDVKTHLPYVFLGDAAFTFSPHLLKPFDSNDSVHKPEEVIFNYRLSRARWVVKNAFGILSSRYRIFHRNIIASETLTQNIILATCALHNLNLRREDSAPPKQRVYLPPGYADYYKSNGHLKKGRWRNENKNEEKSILKKLCTQDSGNANRLEADEVRNKFVELFVRRPLHWQFDILPDV